jgi:cell division protein FtsZ
VRHAEEPAEKPSWSQTGEHHLTGTVAFDPASEDDDTDLDVPDFLK